MGFVEEEGLFLAQVRRAHYDQEWERLQRAGSEHTKLAGEAQREYELWAAAEARLRARADTEGLETAMLERLHPLR